MVENELTQLFTDVKKTIEEGMRELNIPGISIAIVDKEKILWAEGFGFTDETKNRKVTPDTLFMIGSLSKAYNVTAFLRAMQKGLIDLDDPLRKHYPEFKWKTRFGDDEADKITFRHLLTHYAGFQHFTDMKPPGEDRFYSFDEYIEKISDSWQKYPVGSRVSYSNAGVDLAAYVLQKISGKSYSEFMRDEVYIPLGMKNSIVEPTEALKTNNCAQGFRGKTQTPDEQIIIPWLGAGAQFSSVNDMANFLMMHFNEGIVNGERYLERKLLEEMYTIPFADKYELTKIGLGIGISKNQYGGELVLRFFGDGPGYFNLHHFFPNLGIGWLLQANQTYNLVHFLFKLAEKVGPALVKHKLGRIPDPITVTDDIKLPTKVELEIGKLKRLEGKYNSRMLNIEIKLQEGQLTFNMQGEEYKLIPHSKRQFSSEKIPLVEFDLDESSRPKTIKLVQSNGRIAILDYDSGPMDVFGPNKEQWNEYSSLYKFHYNNICLYSTTAIKNGYIHLVTNIGNKVYRLTEDKLGIFFTADGQNVVFEANQLITPANLWIKDDISIEKIKRLLKENPEDIHVKKSSLEELLFIYKVTDQKEKTDQLKKIINETYPAAKE